MGSGKSTWAEALVRKLKKEKQSVTHVSEDDFLQPRPFRTDLHQIYYDAGKWKGKSYWEVHENWLRLDLMKQAIVNLNQGKDIQYHPYQRETGSLSQKAKSVSSNDWVVFETSIFSELFDVVVLIEVENNTLLQRKMGRDSDLRNNNKIKQYHQIAQWPFWMRHRPDKPDFTIDNNDMHTPKLKSYNDI